MTVGDTFSAAAFISLSSSEIQCLPFICPTIQSLCRTYCCHSVQKRFQIRKSLQGIKMTEFLGSLVLFPLQTGCNTIPTSNDCCNLRECSQDLAEIHGALMYFY
ncbi:hypothetical protein ATANTOWER_025807 [Ataeniobius toweri]|uniref:Uncharacterized protein n=1 Tax=Ataeniobius toweri TaxID=208326 RepID=A0ABU7AZL2_9TELE|nr:hypothetical protein [Ataeniobius toweri]